MIRAIRQCLRWLRGTKRQRRVGQFLYEEYRPYEKRILDEMDAQLAIPGHNPTKLYLHPRDYRLFGRAARRAAAFGKRDSITEESYRGKQVVRVPWEEL